MGTNIILGCGISGLIFAYYNPDFKIITDKIGGQLNESTSATMLLHDDDNTRALLKDLKICYSSKKHEIRYTFDSETMVNELTVDQKKKLIRKKLTDVNDLPNVIDMPLQDLTLSTNDNFINVLNVNSFVLFNALFNKLKDRIIIDKVKKIDITRKLIDCADVSYEFKHLVSTLPAYVFNYLANVEDKLEAKSITIVLCDKKPLRSNDFDLLYNGDTNASWNRVNKLGNKFLYELTGEIDITTNIKTLNDFKDCEIYSVIHRNNSLIKTKEIKHHDNVTFIGRFATWNHSYKIHHAIRDAIKFSEEQK